MSGGPRHPERRAFHIFWKWLTGADATEIELDEIQNQNDPPDFQFLGDGKLIALEHTYVFGGDHCAVSAAKPLLRPLHDEAIQRRIRDHLDKLLKGASNEIPPIDVSVTFGSGREVKTAEQEKSIARDLLDLIRERLGNGCTFPIELYTTDLAQISSCLVDVIVMSGGPDAPSSSASHHAFGRVDEWGLPDFEAAAKRKGTDLAKYQARFEQCWLLLSAGGSHPTQWIEPSPKACATGIRSQFARVFFVDESRCRVYEIRVENASTVVRQ